MVVGLLALAGGGRSGMQSMRGSIADFPAAGATKVHDSFMLFYVAQNTESIKKTYKTRWL